MKAPDPVKITLSSHGQIVSAELPWDANFDQIMDVIDGMLIAQGWHKDALATWIKERADELRDNDEE